MFCQPYLDEALPSDNICGAAVVDEDPAHIIFGKVHGILANVGANDEGVVVWVVLMRFASENVIGTWDQGVRKCLPSHT